MAKTVIALEATFNTSGAEGSVKSLKAQLKEAQADVAALADKFGATSEEAVNAAKKAADLRDRIGDAKALTDAFNPDAKFKAFSSALQGVVGGFSALQGAQALFGSQSEELTKTLAKVQGAMALSQGLNSVLEAKDAFINLGTVLKTNVVSAFNGLKAAIGSTGIGLLVIALPILIANFDKIKQVISNLFPGLAKLGGFIMDLVQNITDFVGITSEAQRATEKLIESNKKSIDETDRFLKFNADKYDEYTVRKIKANNEFKKNQNEILENDKLNDKQKQDLIKQAREFANREIDRAEADRAAKAQESANKQAEERKKIKEQKDAERLKANQERQQKIDEELSLEIERMEREIEADAKYKAELDKNAEDALNAEMDRLERQAEADIKYKEEQLEREKTLAQGKKDIQDATINNIEAGIQLIASLGGKSKAIQKAALIAESAVGIAKIVINTKTANALAKASPINAVDPTYGTRMSILNNVSAAIGIAANIAATAKALQNLGGGGSAGGGNAGNEGTTAPVQPQVATTTLNQGQVNQLASATSRAFVLESDISGNQERIQRLNRAARIN